MIPNLIPFTRCCDEDGNPWYALDMTNGNILSWKRKGVYPGAKPSRRAVPCVVRGSGKHGTIELNIDGKRTHRTRNSLTQAILEDYWNGRT